MSGFSDGFVTGFANRLAQGIDTRQEDARKYFNKQLEIAQTVGVENRNRVKMKVQDSVSVANQLKAVGVPKDIIMAQANQDPEGLVSFLEEVEKLRLSSPTPLTEETYRSIYELSGEFKAPNEDFATFFSRMYEPISRAASQDPEGFAENPKGSIWASALGLNAMEKANKKLSETEVIDGLSAQDLISYGDNTQPHKVGGSATVTRNPQAAQKIAGNDDSNLNFQTRTAISASIEEQFEEAFTTAVQELGSGAENPEAIAKAAEIAAQKVFEAGNFDIMKDTEAEFAKREVQRMAQRKIGLYSPQEGAEEAPVDPSATTPAPAATQPTAPVPESDPSSESSSQDIAVTKGDGSKTVLKFISNNFDGTATYQDQTTGQLITAPVEQFNELSKRN